jgi:hypothetical protein
LKQAASRYKADATCLGDIEELVDYAIDKLDEPSGVRKVNNNDGTETWYGLPVVVPVGLIPDDETPVEVRSRGLELSGRWMNWKGAIGVQGPLNDKRFPGEFRLLLAAKPQPVTWTPPASLPNGEYLWNGESIEPASRVWSANKYLTLPSLFGDWTDPPKPGRYKVENGTATWIGE